ncbi:hypothetical protein [uncultured Vagococcus sp.]|uniref:hypothetical protein n=1 Tax=uncultured Vagococcus sp. TaxID=189676 RepID=UPI0028D67B0C|nr:hypothetical protein [uncultured Vagococcus sp.]
MGNATRWFVVFCCLILGGGAGLKLFNRNEEQKREQELLRMETTAKEIKHTFAEVKEIEFSEEYVENDLAGYTEVLVTVSTRYGVSSELGVIVFPRDKTSESYLGTGEQPVLEKGVTETKVQVIFSNTDRGSF